MRYNGRGDFQVRDVKFTRNYTMYSEGSVLVEFGNTKVLCNASFSSGVPRFLKGSNGGWITAEYGMLPRSTHSRMTREASLGKQSGRAAEIQRLIARSLRAAVDLSLLGENTITVDCDVIQADGGTRTAAISGACLALYDSFIWAKEKGLISSNPLKFFFAAISFGLKDGKILCDLDYSEDSNASTDMNIVMSELGSFIEIQGTAEKDPFNSEDLVKILDLSKSSIASIIDLQKKAVGF